MHTLMCLQVSPLVAHDNDWGGGFESDSERVALNTLRLAASQSEIHSNGRQRQGRSLLCLLLVQAFTASTQQSSSKSELKSHRDRFVCPGIL